MNMLIVIFCHILWWILKKSRKILAMIFCAQKTQPDSGTFLEMGHCTNEKCCLPLPSHPRKRVSSLVLKATEILDSRFHGNDQKSDAGANRMWENSTEPSLPQKRELRKSSEGSIPAFAGMTIQD